MNLETINKKYLLGGVFVLLVIIPLLLLVLKPSSNNFLFPSSVTPTPVEGKDISNNPNSPLTVVSTNPQDKSLNAPLNSSITIIFNRTPKPNEFRFSSTPEIPGEFEIQGKKLTLKPLSPLLLSTTYSVVLGLLRGSEIKVYSFVFNSLGPTPTPPPDTRPIELITQVENYQRENNPDVFLSNETPYSNSSFSISSAYTKTPSGHFFFSVSLKGANKDTSRSALITWIKSKGLSDSQIQNLDIRYK